MQKRTSALSIFHGLLLCLFLFACSTAPKVSQVNVTSNEAKNWFKSFCSRGARPVSGDLMIRSSTHEFKGQYPASIRFEKNGSFVLEVTSIIGGTLLRLTSDGQSMSTVVPPRPQFNRSGITHYLGLDLPVLVQLLMGDLPCPSQWGSGVRSEGNQMIIQTANWRWNFEKSEASTGSIPVRVILVPVGNRDPNAKVELLIEDWNLEKHFAKKVTVKSPEGELRWTWRNRS